MPETNSCFSIPQSQHQGRKLTWLFHVSKGELKVCFTKNSYILQVRVCAM